MHGLSRRRRTLNFMIWDVVTPDKKETFFKMPNNQIEIALATFHLKSAIVAKKSVHAYAVSSRRGGKLDLTPSVARS